MSRQIDSQEAERNAEFEQLLDEMYYQFHFHPTNIPHFTSTEARDAWIHNLSKELARGSDNSDDWCNGLPRGNRRVSNGRIR